MFTFSYGSNFSFHAGLFFVIIEMFICLASQTDVKSNRAHEPEKKNVVKITDRKEKY